MHYTQRNCTLDINMSRCLGAGLDRMHAHSFTHTHTHVYVDHAEPMSAFTRLATDGLQGICGPRRTDGLRTHSHTHTHTHTRICGPRRTDVCDTHTHTHVYVDHATDGLQGIGNRLRIFMYVCIYLCIHGTHSLTK